MDGYYEPHPLVVLSRTVTLVGHPGSGAGQVGYALSAQTGLPFTELDRLVESLAGRARPRIRVEDGDEALRALESRALDRALARLPHGILVVQSDTLTAPRPRARVSAATCLVAIRRPADVLLRRLRARARAHPAGASELAGGVPETPEELARRLADLEPGLRDAEVLVEAGDRHPLTVAEELLASLDRIAG